MKGRIRVMSVLLAVLMLLLVIPSGVSATEDGLEHYRLLIGTDGKTIEYVPEKDGWYSFYTTGDYDTFGSITDSEDIQLDFSDNDGRDRNLCLKSYLEAGKTYTLDLGISEDEEISGVYIDFYVAETAGAVSVDVCYQEEELVCVSMAELDTVNFSDVMFEFVFSDGVSLGWTIYGGNSIYGGSEIVWDFVRDADGNVIVNDGKAAIYVMCDDAYVEVECTVLENPVESFELDSDFVFYEEYSEGVFDYELGYYVYWNDFDVDDTVTINYKDGTSVTEKAMFFYDDYGCDVEISDNQREKPWKVGEDNYFTAKYLGHEIKVPAEVLPVPIKEVEITKLPDRIEYREGFDPLWQGMEITLTMLDDSTVSGTVNEDELDYDYYGDRFNFTIGDFDIELYDWDGFVVSCFGVETPVEGIITTEGPAIIGMEVKQLTRTGEDTIVEFSYSDGTKETIEFDVVDYWDLNDSVYGTIKTEHGYADYGIWQAYNYDDEFIGYEVWLFDVSAIAGTDKIIGDDTLYYGDANGSGAVDIKDVTFIQKYLAGIIEAEGDIEVVGDVNFDDKVDIRDATAIQKWLADIWVMHPIGYPVTK